MQHGSGKAVAVRQSHISHMVDKIRRDTLGMSNPSPRPNSAAQGYSAGNKASLLLATKTSGGWGSRRNCWSLGKGHLKGLYSPRMNANPPTLGTTTGAATTGTPVWEGGNMTGNRASAEQASVALSPLQPLPHIQSHKAVK